MAGAIERLREFLGEREWAARALDTSAWGRVCARIARIEPPPGGRVVVVVLNARDGALGAALADALGARGGDGAELVLCDARYFVGAPKSWDLAWLEAWLAARPRARLSARRVALHRATDCAELAIDEWCRQGSQSRI